MGFFVGQYQNLCCGILTYMTGSTAPQDISQTSLQSTYQEPTQSPLPQQKKYKKYFPVIFLVLFLISLSLTGSLAYQNYYLKKQIKPLPTPEITVTPTPTIDQTTANWKTYTNSKYRYTIKYPEGFKVDEMEGVTVIYKGEKLKTLPNSPIDPYPPTSLAIYNRTNAIFKNAEEACEAELCQNLNDPAVGQNYKKEQVQINNASGVKVTSVDRKYSSDYYLANSNGSQIVRIPMGANIVESSSQQSEIFNLLQQILSTFTFTK
jgi:hypothetical protein